MELFNEVLRENKNLIEKALVIDNQKWGLEKTFRNIFEIKDVVKIDKNKNYLIIYEGNIEFTKEICEKAIEKNANVIFTINDEYLATNTLIVRIANEIIKEENKNNFIKIYNNIEEKKIFANSKEFDEVKFIGSSYDYRNIIKDINCPCKFIEIEDVF